MRMKLMFLICVLQVTVACRVRVGIARIAARRRGVLED